MQGDRYSGYSYTNMFGQMVQVMQREGGHTGDVIINVTPPSMPDPTTNTWPKHMDPGKTYRPLSRQTTSDGCTYESWYEDGGNTGDVVHITIPPMGSG